MDEKVWDHQFEAVPNLTTLLANFKITLINITWMNASGNIEKVLAKINKSQSNL